MKKRPPKLSTKESLERLFLNEELSYSTKDSSHNKRHSNYYNNAVSDQLEDDSSSDENFKEMLEDYLIDPDRTDKDIDYDDSQKFRYKSPSNNLRNYITRKLLQLDAETNISDSRYSVLDLHGLTREEALKRLDFFIEDAVYQDILAAKIITGKGIHSNKRPVIKEAVEQRLIALKKRGVIKTFSWEKKKKKKSGSIIVFFS